MTLDISIWHLGIWRLSIWHLLHLLHHLLFHCASLHHVSVHLVLRYAHSWGYTGCSLLMKVLCCSYINKAVLLVPVHWLLGLLHVILRDIHWRLHHSCILVAKHILLSHHSSRSSWTTRQSLGQRCTTWGTLWLTWVTKSGIVTGWRHARRKHSRRGHHTWRRHHSTHLSRRTHPWRSHPRRKHHSRWRHHSRRHSTRRHSSRRAHSWWHHQRHYFLDRRKLSIKWVQVFHHFRCRICSWGLLKLAVNILPRICQISTRASVIKWTSRHHAEHKFHRIQNLIFILDQIT